MQRTNFKFEAIVGDDCSTDGTAKIIAEYAGKHPAIIKPVLRNKNLGAVGNSNDVLSKAKGKYIALCEGDDYWIDPLKLQKQVDFLEANPDYTICFHPIKVLRPDGTMTPDTGRDVPETTDVYELAKGNYLHTPSVVFRKDPEVIRDFASLGSPLGDYVMHLLNASRGKIKKIPGIMAVYRQGVGIWREDTPQYCMVLGLLCGYFKSKDKKLYAILMQKKNNIAATYLRTFFQAGAGEKALAYLNSIDVDSRYELLEYLIEAEISFVEIQSSRGWRMLEKMYRLRDLCLPDGSRRWQYVEKAMKFLYSMLSGGGKIAK